MVEHEYNSSHSKPGENFLKSFWDSKQFSDVILVCDDQNWLKAHQVVLSACSSVFKDILTDNDEDETIIYLEGIQYQDLITVLQYLYCGETFDSYRNIKVLKHIARDLRINTLLDSIMDYETKSFEKLFLPQSQKQEKTRSPHIKKQRTQRQVPGTKYCCNVCRQMFPSKYIFKKHTQSNCGQDVQCSLCERKFTSRTSMKDHIKYKHEGKSYPCSFCDQRYSNIWSVKTHIDEKHMGITFDCNQCDKKYSQMGRLTQHRKTVHEGVRYACTFCEHTTGDFSNIRKHLKRWHLNEEQINAVKINPGMQYKQWYKVFIETEESKEKKKALTKIKGWLHPSTRRKDPGKFVFRADSDKRRKRHIKSEMKEPGRDPLDVKIEFDPLKTEIE